LGAAKRTAPNFISLSGKLVLLGVAVLSGLVYALFGAYWHENDLLWVSTAVLLGSLVYLFARLLAEMALRCGAWSRASTTRAKVCSSRPRRSLLAGLPSAA
jgi:hypothetical protein